MPPQVLRRMPTPDLVDSIHLHAPVGGMNTVAPAGAIPDGDCLRLVNMLGSEYGLRSRLGYKEWVTGLGGEVRSVVPFSGSNVGATNDRLFSCTAAGIFQCTTSTNAPTQLVTFGITSGNAGYAVSAVTATPAGRFLLLTDEENGLFVYVENTATWSKILAGVTVPWTSSTTYLVGDKVVNGANTYVVTVAGVSGGSGGPTGTGTGIADNTVTWNFIAAFSATSIGPSLADQRAGFAGLPSNFSSVTVFKNRVWLTEKGSSRAWYSQLNAVYGTYTSFDLGAKMAHGGPLVGLFNWTYNGLSGPDDRLIGISTAGDVVVYQGTDPSQAATFGLVGSRFIGGVPAGRRIATDNGGDFLFLTTIGALPMSDIVSGNSVGDRTQYTTFKIQNLFNLYATTYRSLQGWSIQIHPTDNALLITVPQAAGQPTIQLAYSFSTRGWSLYRGLPMLSNGVWNGQLYFGTTDGRICINTGYVDAVLLSNPNAATPVNWSLLTGFSNGGNTRNKVVQLVRPSVFSETSSPIVQTRVKYGYDISESAPPTGAPSPSSQAAWDTAIWDTGTWGGDYSPTQPLDGAFGIGRELAIEVTGKATSRTILEGIDVVFETGGYL